MYLITNDQSFKAYEVKIAWSSE